ncbi:putative RNA methylase [Bradyrhizobium huanghuaihaiense]
MTDLSPIAADQAAPISPVRAPEGASVIIAAASHLLPHLERGRRIDAAILRAAMEAASGASDATGAWDWKMTYDACEVATVLFLRKYGKALFRKAASPASRLSALDKIAGLLPTHTRRSVESETFQQFSTPLQLGLTALTAAAMTAADRVLEPSAGTGLLAILAEIAGGGLVLNELAETRAALLSSLFPAISVTRFDAAQIDDHLDPPVVPGVVLMNPPFSAMANVSGRMPDTAYRHIASALARLADGGRLTISGANFSPDASAWRDALVRLQERSRVVFTAAIAGAVYAKHGTTIETRLTVIDKAPADDPNVFPESPGVAPDVATLLRWIGERVPPRLSVASTGALPMSVSSAPRTVRGYLAPATTQSVSASRSCRRSRATGPGCRPASSVMASSPTPSLRRSSMLARRMLTILPALGRLTRPSTWSRPPATTRRTRSVSVEASCSGTAPAPARVASPPASFSTIGCKAGARRSGSRSPTSCSRTRSATGRRWAWSVCWSRRSRASLKAARSGWPKASYF